MPRLVISKGPGSGVSFPLAEGDFRIGRDRSAEIQIDDGRASRLHAVVSPSGAGYVVRDQGSSNGTFLNSRRVSEAALSAGDVIRIGDTELTFATDESDMPEACLDDSHPEAPGKTVELKTEGLDPLEAIARRQEAAPSRGTRALLALGRIARELAGAKDAGELHAAMTAHLKSALDADRLFFLERGEDPEWRICAAGAGALERKLAATPVSRTIVSHVADRRLPTLIRDTESDERFAGARSIQAARIVTAAAAPVLSGGRLLGVLYADRLGRGESFTEEDLEIVAVAASLSSLHAERLETLERATSGRAKLEREIRSQYSIIGESPEMREVFDFIGRAAPTDAGVLILGESGTGKELVARAIHFASKRSGEPFEVVNCAALAESLAESELFGHAKGAFTGASSERQGRFELADGGTIFLDEVGELSAACQSKLLRVLENGESVRVGESKVRRVNVRVVAATNRDLDGRVREGGFRQDLFYRLNVLRTRLPALRERKGDVELLAEHFLAEFARRMGKPAPRLSPEARGVFGAYGWPGNVRELKNVCERMVVMGRSEVIGRGDLPPEMLPGGSPDAEGGGRGEAWNLDEVERAHILAAMRKCGGNKTTAAELLGIDRSTLYARLKKYGEDTGE